MALTKYSYNDTQQSMDNEFIDEDHAFIWQEGRQQDESHLEQQRLTEIWDNSECVIVAKREKDAERAQRAAEEAAKVAASTLIEDQDEIKHITCEKLNDQLAILRQWDNSVHAKLFYKVKQDKLNAVLTALDRYDDRNRVAVLKDRSEVLATLAAPIDAWATYVFSCECVHRVDPEIGWTLLITGLSNQLDVNTQH